VVAYSAQKAVALTGHLGGILCRVEIPSANSLDCDLNAWRDNDRDVKNETGALRSTALIRRGISPARIDERADGLDVWPSI
jgi:hypothetical protein